jgi:PAS domain S-box-containing protein
MMSRCASRDSSAGARLPINTLVSTDPQSNGPVRAFVPNGARRGERRATPAARAERLFEMSPDMLGTASLDGYFTHLNPAWERTLGWTAEQLMAEPLITFVHPDDAEQTLRRTKNLVSTSGTQLLSFENRCRTSTGDFRWVKWDVVSDASALYFVARDVTKDKAAFIRFEQDASVMQAVLESVADGLYVADAQGLLTFINPAGVLLLGYDSAAELIGRNPHMTFHHTHADGVAYPIEDCPLTTVRLTGEAIRADEDGFWRKDGSAMPVSYSSAPVELEGGTGSVVAFRDITERQTRELRERRELEALSWVGRIRDALDEDRLVLYAQPIIELATGNTVHHELLVRMIAPGGDVIAPDAFLPVAEEHGLIRDIDRRVFDLAIRHAGAGHPVAINVSAESISEPGLFRYVEEQLADHGIDPELIIFEITETALVRNEGVAQVFIESVRRLGCGVALDDFGTGYGSFRYLKHLPVSALKVDQEFVRDLEGETSMVNRHVIEATVTLARGMGKKTVAEGVETESTLAIVRELGVDYAQGYLFARPGPALQLLPLIRQET